MEAVIIVLLGIALIAMALSLGFGGNKGGDIKEPMLLRFFIAFQVFIIPILGFFSFYGEMASLKRAWQFPFPYDNYINIAYAFIILHLGLKCSIGLLIDRNKTRKSLYSAILLMWVSVFFYPVSDYINFNVNIVDEMLMFNADRSIVDGLRNEAVRTASVSAISSGIWAVFWTTYFLVSKKIKALYK